MGPALNRSQLSNLASLYPNCALVPFFLESTAEGQHPSIWEGSTDTSARRPYPKMNGTHDLFPPLTSTNTNTNYSSRKSHSSDYQRKKRQNRWLMSFFFPQAISSHGRIQNNGPSQSLLFALTVPAQGSSSQLLAISLGQSLLSNTERDILSTKWSGRVCVSGDHDSWLRPTGYPTSPSTFQWTTHVQLHTAWPGFIKNPSVVSYPKAQACIYRARFRWGVCCFKTGHRSNRNNTAINKASITPHGQDEAFPSLPFNILRADFCFF
ncbi:hypothetical protein NXS19_003821 [Fusarium pseudograminearum]|nr:hypothetical protein NXS19_003821 [Fusarium pseudograminearum]